MTQRAVVDASVALKWVVEENGSAAARSLSKDRLDAPDLFLVECANALRNKVVREELSSLDGAECLAALKLAPIEYHTSQGFVSQALDLALHLGHPVYDCLYLALALRRRIPLITADEEFCGRVRSNPGLKDAVVLLREIGV